MIADPPVPNPVSSPTGTDPKGPSHLTNARVVIAEDEAIIRLDLKEILEEEGYVVVGDTGRGDVAIDLTREHKPDLVILDIKMPGMDGLEAAKKIAEERLAAVLILTAFSQHDLVEQARDAGALAYLVKPFQKSDLIPAIEMALARHEQMLSLERENADLAARLEARKLIDRAKGRLMDEHGMTEAASWRFLQTTAMRTRRTIGAVAGDVIAGTLLPESSS
jgi:response regulator NasT